MTNKGNALMSFLVLALGVVFIWLCNRAYFLHSVVMLCGLTFVVPAVISLLSVFFAAGDGRRSAVARVIQLVCGIGGLGLGVCIMLMPDTFRALLVYLFAALLVAGGIFQVFLLSRGARRAAYPGWLLAVPILVLVAGVVMVCAGPLRRMEHEAVVVLVTGCSLAAYGLNGIILSVMHYRALRAQGTPDGDAAGMAAITVQGVGDGRRVSDAGGTSAHRFDAETAADVDGNQVADGLHRDDR